MPSPVLSRLLLSALNLTFTRAFQRLLPDWPKFSAAILTSLSLDVQPSLREWSLACAHPLLLCSLPRLSSWLDMQE